MRNLLKLKTHRYLIGSFSLYLNSDLFQGQHESNSSNKIEKNKSKAWIENIFC